MEPPGSLLHSHELTNCPCSEPVHVLSSHFLKIQLNIPPSMSGSSKWSLCLRFPHQNPVCTPTHTHTCYMPGHSHWSWFDHPNSRSFSNTKKNFILHSAVKELYIQRKLWIISMDFDTTGQLLIIYSAFVKYLRKNGKHSIYRLWKW